MNTVNDISDEEFIPFLRSLGVETYKKSFEWMFNDPDFGGVLCWLFDNLDHNNALSAREEYRFAEIEKKGQLLSKEDLDQSVSLLLKEYEGICLPGDKDNTDDVKLDIEMNKERLQMLEKQQALLNDLIEQNKLMNEDLGRELTELHSAQQQCIEDEMTASEECLNLAKEVDSITEGVVEVVGNTLNVYSTAHIDKDIASKFYALGPFESYQQTQALFRSHYDLFLSKKLINIPSHQVSDEELRSAVVEAKVLEERLHDALTEYVESKADLAGEQAKVIFALNYKDVQASQVTERAMELQSAISIQEQEESILQQQLQNAIKGYVEARTKVAIETTSKSALAVRETIHKDLSYLVDMSQQALALDRLLYIGLRQELKNMEEFLQFAAHLKQHVIEESEAVSSRIDSMIGITAEQEDIEPNLIKSDLLLTTLCNVFNISSTNDVQVVVKTYADLLRNIEDLKESVVDGYRRKELALDLYKLTYQPLLEYIYDGCTKLPNCYNTTVGSLTHNLKKEMDKTDARVLEVSGLFTSVKKNDKHSLRKLWQWFLTNPQKLLSAMKEIQCYNH